MIYIFVFVIGACIGSFLNVVIHRVPNEMSLLPSSKCPKCNSGIKPWHNVPIIGWIMLGGKCASCKEPISWRYPTIEALTGLLFLIVFMKFSLTAFLPIALVFVSVMVALVFIDAEHMILPNVVTYPLLIFALLVRIIYPITFGHVFSDTTQAPLIVMQGQPAWLVSFVGALVGALIGGGSLWLIGELWKRLRGVDAMGMGDVKMMLGVGALLGWRLSLLTIFAGALSGAVIGIIVLSRQKDKNLQTQIPFGIFLGIGSIVALLIGESLIAWYLGMFS